MLTRFHSETRAEVGLLLKILLLAAALVVLAYGVYVGAFLLVYVALASENSLRRRLLQRFLPGFCQNVTEEREIIEQRMGTEAFSSLDQKLIRAERVLWRCLLILVVVSSGIVAWQLLR